MAIGSLTSLSACSVKSGFSIEQPVQQIEDMDFGQNAHIQRHVDGGERGPSIMVQDQRQDLDHSRSPPGLRSRCRRNRWKMSGILRKSIPSHRAPGLRWAIRPSVFQ